MCLASISSRPCSCWRLMRNLPYTKGLLPQHRGREAEWDEGSARQRDMQNRDTGWHPSCKPASPSRAQLSVPRWGSQTPVLLGNSVWLRNKTTNILPPPVICCLLFLYWVLGSVLGNIRNKYPLDANQKRHSECRKSHSYPCKTWIHTIPPTDFKMLPFVFIHLTKTAQASLQISVSPGTCLFCLN